MKPIIIIGTGLAGYTLAREFRRMDQERPLLLVSRDDGAFYSKPMLSAAFAQNKDPGNLVISSAEKMAETLKAEILTQAEVTAIDPAEKTILTPQGKRPFHKLVIASGATPIRPPLKGDAAEEVLSVNNLNDYDRFRAAVENKKRVAISGPGLIGCEFANDMLHAEKSVTLIGPDPWPISSLIPEPVGRALQKALEEKGVGWRLGRMAVSLSRKGDAYLIELDNGETLEADVMLSAVGLRPDLSLAEKAGLACNRGIVCDSNLRTSSEDIYALGDCAEVAGRNLPYVMPLMAGAKALAKTLAGRETNVTYPWMPVVIKTTLYPVVAIPPNGKDGRWEIEEDASGVKARWFDPADRFAGFALSGDRVVGKQAMLKELGEPR